MNYPTITIITLTYNVGIEIWIKVLESIKHQDYPKGKIEHLVMDGGSDNDTVKIARRYGCTVHSVPALRTETEARKGRGIAASKGEIIAFIEADNILPDKKWLAMMVRPFIEHKKIAGTFSIYNKCDISMPVLTRYCALFGINDPVVYYLGKSEKLPWFKTEYELGKILEKSDGYTVVEFSQDNLPTMGDNGHMVRRELISKVNRSPDKFLHTDAYAKLLDLGYATYGVVHNSIIHYTGSDIRQFLNRRTVYKKRMYDDRRSERHYLVYDPASSKDRIRLFLFIIYSVTFIEPLIQSVRGYFKVRDPAWFLHPVVCLMTLFSYTYSVLKISIARLNF